MVDMKYLKITHKNKNKSEIRYLPSTDLKDFRYDPKSKYLELEIRNILESGFAKLLSLVNFEIFLTSPSPSIFSIELVDSEEEVS